MIMQVTKNGELQRNVLSVVENHALDILVNLPADKLKSLETEISATSDSVDRGLLDKFVKFCQTKGLDLSEAGVNAFKDMHGLGNTGALHGVIGPQTASFYFNFLTSSHRKTSSSGRHINQAGLQLVEEFEGFARQVGGGKVTAYIDPVGVPTIGFGHTRTVTAADVNTKIITRQEAERLLMQDLAEAEADVNDLITVPLTDNQFSALVSFTFNLGGGALSGSTLRKLLNKGDYKGAADQFLRWVNGGGQILPGLVRRRKAERELFLS